MESQLIDPFDTFGVIVVGANKMIHAPKGIQRVTDDQQGTLELGDVGEPETVLVVIGGNVLFVKKTRRISCQS